MSRIHSPALRRAHPATVAATVLALALFSSPVSHAGAPDEGKRRDLNLFPLPAITAQATTGTSTMTLGNCEDVQSPDNPHGILGGQLSPAAPLQRYWYQKFNEVLQLKDAKVTVLQPPMHGILQGNKPSRNFGPSFIYVPNSGFLGQDKVTFLVEVAGKRVKVETALIVVEVAGLHESPCFKDVKRISGSDRPDLAANLTIRQVVVNQ